MGPLNPCIYHRGCGHDGAVTPIEELVTAVDAAFVATGREMAGWPHPHPDRMPLAEEYSRVSNRHKWQILAARAEAWLVALANAGLSEIDSGTEIGWEEPPRLDSNRTYLARPRAADALPLIVCMERLGDMDDAGVTLGVGDPAVLLLSTPDCGCDACDSGSQDALDELDEYVLSVVTGSYRRLRRGEREITIISEGHRVSRGFDKRRIGQWGFMTGPRILSRLDRFQGEVAPSSGYYVMRSRKILTRLPRIKVGVAFPKRRRDHIERVLANPEGWNEIYGAAWFNEEEQV